MITIAGGIILAVLILRLLPLLVIGALGAVCALYCLIGLVIAGLLVFFFSMEAVFEPITFIKFFSSIAIVTALCWVIPDRRRANARRRLAAMVWRDAAD